jgi:membrane protein
VSPFVTQEVVQEVVLPTLADALARPRVDLISVGFALSVWSGSRALNVFVDTISIMYGLGGRRGIVRTRLLSLTLYLASLVLASVTLPLALLGPTLLGRWLPPRLLWLLGLAWPVALLGGVALLATLYHVATPVRARWLRTLPGALLALVIWLLTSWLLRRWLGHSVGGTSVYGPLTTTVLVLIWSYFLAIAVLIGAGLNAASQALWPTPGTGLRPPLESARDASRQDRGHEG